MIDQILSRLGIDGIALEADGTNSANKLVVTTAAGTIDSSLYSATAATTAAAVSYDPAGNQYIDDVTVQAALDTIDSTVMMRENNLIDVENTATAFDTIKQVATTSASGVVATASSSDVDSDLATRTINEVSVPLFITPAVATSKYIKKSISNSATQTILSKLLYDATVSVTESKQFTDKNYVDTALASTVAVETKNMLWVSANNGSDSKSSNDAYKIGLPYLTIGAAIADASDGDTIVVLPGTYNEANIVSETLNLNYFFYPGATVDYTGGSAVAIFNCDTAGLTTKVYGYGRFINRSTITGSYVVNLASTHNLIMEADYVKGYKVGFYLHGSSDANQINIRTNVETADTTGLYAFNISSGKHVINVAGKIYSNDQGVIISTDALARISASEIGGAGYAIQCTGGTSAYRSIIKAETIYSTGSIAIYSSNGVLLIESESIYTDINTTTIYIAYPSDIIIKNSLISRNNNDGTTELITIANSSTSYPLILLNNVKIDCPSLCVYSVSAGGAGNTAFFNVMGSLRTNKPMSLGTNNYAQQGGQLDIFSLPSDLA